VGTDAGVGPGKPHDVLPHALAHLAQAGFSPTEMLTILTADAAEVCRVGDHKGRLRAGYDADVLVVRGDPTSNASALLDVEAVWCRGRRVR
jgi:imidazolonepropionase-like amidohydrolase